MEICRLIGLELKKTLEGTEAIASYNSILEHLSDNAKELFIKPFPHIPWGIHFYTTQAKMDLLIENIDNAVLGHSVKEILNNPYLKECAPKMQILGDVIDKITNSLFQNNVQYSLPEQIHATPQLYRYIQDLSVECQNTKILQNMLGKIQQDTNFLEICTEIEHSRALHTAPPYSKDDRAIIKKLCKKGYNSESVKTIYSFITIVSMIKETIYASFMGEIYEIKEREDILDLRERTIDKIALVQMDIAPSHHAFEGKEKWIMRIEKTSGEILYGQIFSKTMKFGIEGINIKQRAIIFLSL